MHQKSTPKDIFLSLFHAGVFYVSVISYITLLIQYVNVLFPDKLEFQFRYENTLESIFWSTAVLIVAFPTYIFTAWLIARDSAKHPEKREMKIKKWLTHGTLFAASIAIVIDLITLIFNFLRGELTLPFFLKVTVVLFVAGAVFWYYYWDLKRDIRASSPKPKTLAWIISTIVVASIGAEFFLVGTPGVQRNIRLDERRVQDLQVIQSQIVNFWQQKGKLPETVDALRDDISGFIPPRDPETRGAYEYRAAGTLSFELCAEFKTSSRGEQTLIKQPLFPDAKSISENWEHKEGRQCFSRTIDPEIYRPIPLEKR